MSWKLTKSMFTGSWSPSLPPSIPLSAFAVKRHRHLLIIQLVLRVEGDAPGTLDLIIWPVVIYFDDQG